MFSCQLSELTIEKGAFVSWTIDSWRKIGQNLLLAKLASLQNLHGIGKVAVWHSVSFFCKILRIACKFVEFEWHYIFCITAAFSSIVQILNILFFIPCCTWRSEFCSKWFVSLCQCMGYIFVAWHLAFLLAVLCKAAPLQFRQNDCIIQQLHHVKYIL